ncbi:MAG: GNAT family N-acetyltransferase, partial [Methanomassiliicoccales archaeon]|nr:GNAT family N-acetyltransferase [Methanomassiliicoccales archaeon]
CGGRSFLISGVEKEDWEWIKDGIAESMIKSIPESYQADPVIVRERAILEAGKLWDNPSIRNELLIAKTEGEERAGALWMVALPFQYTGEMRGWVLQIFVSEQFRGIGLGKALMKIAEEWTLEEGLHRIGLNVGTGNKEAIALYRSSGFLIEGYNMGKALRSRAESNEK